VKGRVFLTGASGRIGRWVLRGLAERGYPLRALVHRHRPEVMQDAEVEIVEGDLLDRTRLKEAVKECRYVCHLAAAWDMFPPAVHERENNQLFESVIRGTYNLLEASYPLRDLALFVYASTDAVYATGFRKFERPVTEDTSLVPSRFYALAKILGESMCMQYGNLYGLPWFIARICWSLAPDELLRIFSLEFWEEALSPEDLKRLKPEIGEGKGVFAPLLANGESAVDQIADPRDVAQGIVLGIDHHEKAKGQVCNLASPAPFRYLEVIERLARGLGVPRDSARAEGIEPYELRSDRAREILGYNPVHTMEEMIDNAVALLRGRG
jgi:nucleoside-diphosphate-sugar epimerase